MGLHLKPCQCGHGQNWYCEPRYPHYHEYIPPDRDYSNPDEGIRRPIANISRKYTHERGVEVAFNPFVTWDERDQYRVKFFPVTVSLENLEQVYLSTIQYAKDNMPEHDNEKRGQLDIFSDMEAA